ncbi:MAG: ABC transporter substrate-binding protein [Oscillospiraceae bacterium]|nr:ABC transporter substrate-binding protein [Oscillospiraceae bacterium]
MKKLLTLLLALTLLLTLAACYSSGPIPIPTPTPAAPTIPNLPDPPAPLTIPVGTLNGNTGVAAAWLMAEAQHGNTHDTYNFEVFTAPDQVAAALLSGQVQIAALPTNVTATLYNRSEGMIQMAAIVAYGVLHILENGDEIHTIEDLRGRTIHTTGEGAGPEFILNHILTQNGLIPGVDVHIEFHPNEALASLMAAGQIDLSMMPEPMVTSVLAQNDDVRRALDMTTEWDNIGDGTQLVMSSVVVRTDFAEANPEAVGRFLTLLEQSIAETVQNPAEVAALIAEFGIIPSAAIAERAIPGCNLTFIAGRDMEPAITGYFEVLYAADPASLGGAIPDANFYLILP